MELKNYFSDYTNNTNVVFVDWSCERGEDFSDIQNHLKNTYVEGVDYNIVGEGWMDYHYFDFEVLNKKILKDKLLIGIMDKMEQYRPKD